MRMWLCCLETGKYGLHPDIIVEKLLACFFLLCVYLCVSLHTLYLSAAAGLSLLWTELGPQVLPFFLIPFFTSSNSSGLKRVLRPHVRLLSSCVTVNTVTTAVNHRLKQLQEGAVRETALIGNLV